MRLLRVFAPRDKLLAGWLDISPPLPSLLLCFGLKPEKAHPEPVSVYQAATEAEEVEVVGAHYLTTGGSPEKRVGVIVTEDDCRAAGVTLDLGERGTTGVEDVDGRHVNLKGDTVEQFGRLMARIVQGMWQGEQRIRFYPAQQIAGQIAVFSKYPEGRIDQVTREACQQVLQACNWHTFEENPRAAVIRGSLERKPEFPIIARRAY